MKKLLLVLLLLPSLAFGQDNSTARRPFGQHTQTFSATPVFDAGTTDSWKMTLTANVTSSTLIGAEAGHTYVFEICQDGTGGRTFAWPANIIGPIAILAGPNVCTTEIFPFDGTNANNPTTTTSGGGGSGTVNAGTAGHFTWYAGAGTTVSSNANTDDGITNVNALTYAGTAGIFSPSFNSTSAGAFIASGTEGACGVGTAGKDILCLGDSLAHTAKISNNGGSFLTIPQYSNDSPTPYGPLCADTTFPRIITVPIGSVGQALISTGNSSCFAYGALDVSNASNVTGRIQKANIITSTVFNDQTNTGTAAFTLDLSASTASGSFRVPNIAGMSTTVNGVFGYNSTSNNFIGGMNSGNSVFPVTTVTPVNNNCVKWVVTSGNFQLGDAGAICSAGGGSPALSSVTALTGSTTIANGNFTWTPQWQLTSAGAVGMKITETAASTSTGTPYLLQVSSVAASTANPVRFDFNGNGVSVNTAGLLAKLGTGGLDAPSLLGIVPCANHQALTGDVTTSSGSCATTLATSTSATGVVVTNVAAPSSPAAGKDTIFTDSTDLRLHDKNASGVIGTTVVADTGASNNFLTAISTAGAISKAQPAFTNISGTATAAQIPANVKIRQVGTTFGDTTGSALTSGSVVYVTVPFACTISAFNITADAGTVTFDVWKIATGTAIPTVTNTITASALPALSSGTAIHSTTLTGWTTAVTANDIFAFQLKTVSTAKYVSLVLECDQ